MGGGRDARETVVGVGEGDGGGGQARDGLCNCYGGGGTDFDDSRDVGIREGEEAGKMPHLGCCFCLRWKQKSKSRFERRWGDGLGMF